MPRKPKTKTEWRIVCSGKGKPWHAARGGTGGREHRHLKKNEKAARDAVEDRNDNEAPHPLGAECQPWVAEKREIIEWHPA